MIIKEAKKIAIAEKGSIYSRRRKNIEKMVGKDKKNEILYKKFSNKLNSVILFLNEIIDNNEFEILIVGGDVQQKLKNITETMKKFSNEVFPVVKNSLILKNKTASLSSMIGQIIRSEDKDKLKFVRGQFSETVKGIEGDLEFLEGAIDEESAKFISKIKDDISELKEMTLADHGIIELISGYIDAKNRSSEAVVKAGELSGGMISEINLVLEDTSKETDIIILLTKGVIHGSRILIVLCIAGSFFAVFFLSLICIRLIVNPIKYSR